MLQLQRRCLGKEATPWLYEGIDRTMGSP